MSRSLEDIAETLIGAELLCEKCGTVLSLFDDECANCGESTGFGNDGYYIGLREEAEAKYEKNKKRSKNDRN